MTYTRTRRGRSWHVAAANDLTRCGRNIDPDAETFDQLPSGKSCETCLRWVAREVEEQVVGRSDTYTATADTGEDRLTL